MKDVLVRLSDNNIKDLDMLVHCGKLYASRLEAIRAAIRDLLTDHKEDLKRLKQIQREAEAIRRAAKQ